MKRSVAVALFAMAMVVVLVRAQEKPAAEPAVQAAAPAVQPAAQPAAPAVAAPAAPAVQPAAPAPEDPRQQFVELSKQIAALERAARKNDPTLNAKLDDLDKQQRQIYIQAKPELEALYAQQDVLQDKVKGGGKGGKAKQGGAQSKAEKRAERATQKAEKATQK